MFLGHSSHQTSPSNSGGKTPKWGETLVFQNTGDLDLRVEVWDVDLSDNPLMIGSGSVNLTKIMNIGGEGAASKNILIKLGLILDTKEEMQADCVWLWNLEKVVLVNKKGNI